MKKQPRLSGTTKFQATFQQLDEASFRQHQIIDATITMPRSNKAVHFYVAVGLDGQDKVYVKIGNYRNDKTAYFKPAAHKLETPTK